MAVATGPFIGFGCDLGDSATNSGYASVGHIVDIDGPDAKVGEVDISYVQMANAWKLFIAKLIDGGTVKFKLEWRESTYAHVLGLLRTAYFFQITMPDTGGVAGSTITFQGYYSALPLTMHLEDMIVSEVEIKVSGIVAITSPAANSEASWGF